MLHSVGTSLRVLLAPRRPIENILTICCWDIPLWWRDCAPSFAGRSGADTSLSICLGTSGLLARLSRSTSPEGPWGELLVSKLILMYGFFFRTSSVSVGVSDITISWTNDSVLFGFRASWTLTVDFPLTRPNRYRISSSIDLSSHRSGASSKDGSGSCNTETKGPARRFG